MSPDFAQRVLALPENVRATLAGVPGPGWSISDWHESRGRATAQPGPNWLEAAGAWWPANPAAAVAAVLGCPIYTAHYRLYQADSTGDDHAAALSIIEAHAASRSTP